MNRKQRRLRDNTGKVLNNRKRTKGRADGHRVLRRMSYFSLVLLNNQR